MEPQASLAIHSSPSSPQRIRLRFGDVATGAAAVTLLVGACLKLLTEVQTPSGTVPWILVGFELMVAASLILYRNQTWPTTVAGLLFAAFAIVAFRLHQQGEVSCGCFGPVSFRPLFVGVADVILSSVLLVTAWLASPIAATRIFLGAAATAVSVVAMLLPLGWIGKSPQTQSPWVGKTLTSILTSDIDAELSRGRWSVLFYRSDCPSCRVKLVELVRQSKSDPSRRAAVVVLPSRANSSDAQLEGLLVGKVLASSAPPNPSVILELVNGVVVADNTTQPIESAQAPENSTVLRTTRSADGTFFIDLGYVKPNAHLRIEMIAEDLPALELKRADIECSCTTIVVQPAKFGGSSDKKVVIDFAAPAEAQVYSKGIVWDTDHPAHAKIRFRLRARIGLPLRIDPLQITVSRSAPAQRMQVTLHNDGEQPVSVLSIKGDGATISGAIPPHPVPSGENIVLSVGPLPRESDRGSDQYRLSFNTDVRDQPLLQIVVNLIP